jgi:phosphoribosylformylglycinamidine cyclo-ligase
VFRWLAEAGNIDREEMFRTFNCGVGMVACVPATAADDALACLAEHGLPAWTLGTVEAGEHGITLAP